MQVAPVQLGFSVADGERVDVSFADGDLALRFVDWREQIVKARFLETLAFRWASRPSLETPRDDSTYEVVDSVWLQDEVRLDGLTNQRTLPTMSSASTPKRSWRSFVAGSHVDAGKPNAAQQAVEADGRASSWVSPPPSRPW
jgi:hypothetical protein